MLLQELTAQLEPAQCVTGVLAMLATSTSSLYTAEALRASNRGFDDPYAAAAKALVLKIQH
jgi:hypothetical protein